MPRNSRAWAWIEDKEPDFGDDEDTDLRRATREKTLNDLTNRWNELQDRIEERSWELQDQMRGEGERPPTADDMGMSDDEFSKWRHDETRRPQVEQDQINDQLQALGARIMRPYEHHNEHEMLVEYLERDRD